MPKWLSSFAGLAALAFSAPALAEYLVVKSSGPSGKAYPPGTELARNSKIKLELGDGLMILGPYRIYRLRGPGTFSLSWAKQASLVGRRGRFGARRTASAEPSVWDIDISKGGRICVADPDKLVLRREEPSKEIQLTITAGDRPAARVTWPAGTRKIAWPGQLRIEDGATYKLIGADGAVYGALRFVAVPRSSTIPVAAAKALIAGGCHAQLSKLIEQLGSDGY